MTENPQNPQPPLRSPASGDPAAPPEGTPRWVKAFGITAGVLIVIFLAVHIAGGGLGHHGM